MQKRLRVIFNRGITLLIPVAGSLLAGSLLIWLAGEKAIPTYINLFNAGFSCTKWAGRCALLTTLQFATPLVFSGLSAVVALRAGFFSIGQAGQMLFGAAAAAWVGAHLGMHPAIHPATALLAAVLFGALWGIVPALLREFIGVNEIISTLLLNPIAGFLVGQVWIPRISESAYLVPLVPGTKVTVGLLLALAAVISVYLFLWRSGKGLEIRNNAQAHKFAVYGGIKKHAPVLTAMAVSGALAGLAGAVEVLGVHYRFVSSFSAVNDFDGLIVAFAGYLHPIGALVLSVLLGGLRSGAIVGLQIRSGIPRELGGALIALMLIFAAMHSFYRVNGKHGKR
ncbi:MAG: ABC transporter permease [Pelolinea sp.]|nr:ABC transporter permease [Pelolinea sp.]